MSTTISFDVLDAALSRVLPQNWRQKALRAIRQELNCPPYEIRRIKNWRVAVVQGRLDHDTRHMLYDKENVEYIIYEDVDDFYYLGIAQRKGSRAPKLYALRPPLKGWFIHPEGWLACWGSESSPRACPPPDNTPQDAHELFNVLKKYLMKVH